MKITKKILMKYFPHIVFILAACFIIILSLLVSGVKINEPWKDSDTGIGIGEISQHLLVKYDDGTSEEIHGTLLKFLRIRYDEKPIDSMQYVFKMKPSETYSPISIDYDDFYLVFSFEYNYQNIEHVVTFEDSSIPAKLYYNESEEFQDAFWAELSPFDIINLSVPDGDYEIKMKPSGNLFYLHGTDWKEATLPQSLLFTLNVKDERAVSVSFTSG